MYITHDIKRTSQLQLHSAQYICGSNPLDPFHLAPQIRLSLTIVRVYKLYLLTYLLNIVTVQSCQITVHQTCQTMTAISSRKCIKTGSEMLPFGRKTIFIGNLVTSNNQFGFKKQLSSSHAVPILHLPTSKLNKSASRALVVSYPTLSFLPLANSAGVKTTPLISSTKNFSPCNLAYNMYHEFNHSRQWPVISQSNHSNFTKIGPFESEKLKILLGNGHGTLPKPLPSRKGDTPSPQGRV